MATTMKKVRTLYHHIGTVSAHLIALILWCWSGVAWCIRWIKKNTDDDFQTDYD